MTLIFDPLQALMAAKAGARFVSPFIGRLDDIGTHGVDMLSETVQIIHQYGFDTEIIAASIRHPTHVLDAAEMTSRPFPTTSSRKWWPTRRPRKVSLNSKRITRRSTGLVSERGSAKCQTSPS